jgi:hypothetical protein
MQKSSSEKTSEEPSSLPDGTIAVDVWTTETLGAVTTVTTKKGGIGAMTTAMTSEVNDLVTTIRR